MSADIAVRSVAGAKFTQEVDTGRHKFLADEPEAKGGTDRGPAPYELLLAALGS